jgi:riboflavin synthase
VFTGLVADKGVVRGLAHGRVEVETALAGELQPGDSIAVNGVCLTATERDNGSFAAEVMPETLRRTSLAPLEIGDEVNLELPLRAGDRMGGHMVQGHVDGTGTVQSVAEEGNSRVVRIEGAPELLRYVVEKGSIAIDGVSLTVAELSPDAFAVALVPHTLGATTLAALRPGQPVNLEADVLAKYVERLVSR